MPLHVLIVEDQPAVATALEVLCELHGLRAAIAPDPAAALARLAEGDVAVVVQDMNFLPGETSGRGGVELFRELRRRDPDLPVLLLTAWTSLPTAVELVKEGAVDYVAKPWDDERLAAQLGTLVRRRESERARRRATGDVESRRRELAAAHDLGGLVWASAALQAVVEQALRAAASDVPVLITGPSGVGKERVAELVQSSSPRRDSPFVRVNAGALPDELLESELFGAEAGAYTGLKARREGRFERAHGGTLFLDEIANLSPSGQRKLLRVLQSGELQRLGSSATRRVDVRILCATNADLRREVAAGRFREDLFYRLAVVELRVPPLGERPADVLPIARAILAGLPPFGSDIAWQLDPAAEAALLRHDWPGNVRELENTLRRAVVFARSATLEPADLALAPPASAGAPDAGPGAASAGAIDPERLALERVLAAAGGNVSRAAEQLGLSRQALYRRLERHGLALRRRVEDDLA